MAGRTIHIVDGMKMSTARWSLKMELEVFGKIDVCNMGDRHNQREHPAWVKFNTREGAEKAMEAMAASKVICNGEAIKGEWRKEVAPPTPLGDILDAPELNLTSRDLFGVGQNTKHTRRRSRSRRRRSRSRRRSKSRSRSRRGRRSRSRRDRRSRSRNRRSRSRRRSLSRRPGRFDMMETGNVAPVLALADANSDSKKLHGACPLGHGLWPAFTPQGEAAIRCEICEVPQETDEIEMLRCKSCNYYLCKQCVNYKVLI